MKTNRREFIQTLGTGAAGIGIASALPLTSCTTSKKKAINKVIKAEDTFPYRVGEGRKKLMWPIKSELKSKRLKFDAPIDPVSWAYMKELRENNTTKKIYDINPYVEVYKFRDNLYGLFAENCDGGGDYWMFLTVGPERALLIDTGYGLGDLKGLVEEISGGKPVMVTNTHEHFDHAYGNCRFDKVYCHEYLVPMLESQHEHMFDYLFDDYGDNIWLDFDREDLPKFKKYEIVGVPDGYIFNLGGGYEVELMYQGGHSPGHAAFIDKENHVVFTGDNIICDTSGCGSVNGFRKGPAGGDTSLKAYRYNLQRLIDRMDEFDHVYPGHFMVDVENGVLPNELETIDAILANPDSYNYRNEKWGKNATEPSGRYAKHIKGFSVVYYGYNKV